MVQHAGQGDQDSREQSGEVTAEDARQQRAGECEVGRLISAGQNARSRPRSENSAKSERHQEALPEAALFAQQHPLKRAQPHQDTGDGRGSSQFQKQGI